MGGQRGGEVEEVKRRKSRKRKEERRGEEMLKEARTRQVRERMAERVREGKERKERGVGLHVVRKMKGRDEERRREGGLLVTHQGLETKKPRSLPLLLPLSVPPSLTNTSFSSLRKKLSAVLQLPDREMRSRQHAFF